MTRKQLGAISLITLSGVLLIAAAILMLTDGNRLGIAGMSDVDLPAGAAPAALRLTVAESGLTVVPAEILREANLLTGALADAQFRLTRDGNPVAAFTDAWNGDEALFFYAQANEDPMAPPAVYWLAAGAGIAMPERAAAPVTEPVAEGMLHFHWSTNEIFVALAESSDPWFGARLFAPGSMSTWELPLTGIEPAGDARVTLRVWSNNETRSVNPDHHLQLSAGSDILLDHTWDGVQLVTISGTIPADVLRNAPNLSLSLPNDTGAPGEDVYLDWITIEYPGPLEVGDTAGVTFESSAATLRVSGAGADTVILDVTDPAAPLLLRDVALSDDGAASFAGGEGSRFHAVRRTAAHRPAFSFVSDREPLRAATRGADYLVIHADVDGFVNTLQPLLDLRAGQGLSTASVNVRQVFDEFGYGRATPDAIREFVHYATEQWDPAPRFVLLVGDASYDVNGLTDGTNPNLIPTRLIYTEFAGYVATDTWFVMPGAQENDARPPVAALGRLPAQGIDDLAIMVDKIIAYEQSATSEWARRALLVADDEQQFNEVTNALASELDGAGYATQQLNMTEREDIDEDILNAFNGGVGLVNYVGHGSVSVWGDERVLETADAASMSNSGEYPIFVTFTCLNGYFNHPYVDALAEALMRTGSGGIVAAVAPSGRSLTTQQRPIADAFYELLLTGEAQTLGEALTAAKIAGADDPFLSDVIHTFNLLGDPALRFRHPAP